MPEQVHSLITALLPDEHQWKLKLLTQWQTIMGNLHAHVTIEKITEDTLYLGVFNSSWLQELYLLSPLLCETINKNLDRARIKQLRFKQVARKKKKTVSDTQTFKPVVAVSVSEREKRHLEKVKDPELRQALQLFLIRCKREHS
jgi:hypothetical protein